MNDLAYTSHVECRFLRNEEPPPSHRKRVLALGLLQPRVAICPAVVTIEIGEAAEAAEE